MENRILLKDRILDGGWFVEQVYLNQKLATEVLLTVYPQQQTENIK